MADEWGAPEASDTPRSPEGVDKLVARIQRLEREVRDVKNQTLRAAGIGVDENGMTVDSSLTVDGSLTTTGPATIGGPTTISGDLDTSGDTTLGGNVAITGTLSLPAGIIDNDALASPVRYGSGFANMPLNPTLTTSEQTFAQFAIPVPSGFSRALVVCIAQVGVRNTSGTASAVASRIYIRTGGSSQWSARDFVSAGAGNDVVSLATIFQAYDSLAGVSQIQVELAALADHTWPSASGGGTVEAFAIFTR